MSAPIKSNPHYRPDVDGLRAVAVLAVLVFHYFPAVLPGGFVGVDVFFVISGFLITGIIRRDLARGAFSLATFWRRRILRIFPSLITVLAVTLAVACAFFTPLELTRLCRHVLAGAGFVSNFLLKSEDGYFDIEGEQKALLHLWSLGIEEQFYILWPIVLMLAHRFRRDLKRTAAVCLTASFVYCVLHMRRHATPTFYLPTSRFWELLVGAYLSLVTVNFGARARDATAITGLGLIAAAAWVLDATSSFPGWRAAVPAVGAALVIGAGPAARVNRWLLSRPGLTAIGRLSFPLYLWHWPVLAIPRIVFVADLAAGQKFALLALTAALTAATYFAVERPIRFTPRAGRACAGLITAMILLATTSALILSSGGLRARLTGPLAAYAGERGYGWADAVRVDRCHLQDRQLTTHAAECVESVRPLVFLWGDSHAASLAPGFRDLQTRTSFGFTQMNQGACPPLVDLTRLRFRTNCNEVNALVLDELARERPDVVVIHSAWTDTRYPMAPDLIVSKVRAAVAHVRTLSPTSTVVVVGPVPRWKTYLSEIKIKHQLLGIGDGEVGLGFDGHVAELDRSLAEGLDGTPAHYVSLYRAICPGGRCVTAFGPGPDDILFKDSNHLTPVAARALVRNLGPELLGGKVQIR